jgi:hypothetical protein
MLGYSQILTNEVSEMNSAKIQKNVRSIGMAAFINYYEVLSKDISKNDKIKVLMNQYDYDGASMRVSFFNQLAESKLYLTEALMLVEKAKRIDKSTCLKAKEYREKIEKIQ